ncbi:MAG: hypothetical protein QXG98_00680 [Candidatus Micrarchaeia archaeon]
MDIIKARQKAAQRKKDGAPFPTKFLQIRNEEGFVGLPIFTRGNKRLQEILERVFHNVEVNELFACSKQRARELNLNEHGHHHALITASYALEILRILQESGHIPERLKHGSVVLEKEDIEVGIALAGLFHDIGNAYHRNQHAITSTFIAEPILDSVLAPTYRDAAMRTSLKAFVQACIRYHDKDVAAPGPIYGIVRVADALDMEEGRARWATKSDMHKISARAIKKVSVLAGTSKPVLVCIEMDNEAGMFQVLEQLEPKLQGSQLKPLIEFDVQCNGEHIRLSRPPE